MNSNFVFFLILLFSIQATNGFSQEVEPKKMSKKVADKFRDKFSKRKFIENTKNIRNDYEDMVIRIKRYKNESIQNDTSLINLYNKTQVAYNNVLDLMIKDINAADNIFNYHLFDANTIYKKQLTEAKIQGDSFLKAADYKLSGDTKFIASIVKWIVKIYPILKKIENFYLDHVKEIMTKEIQDAKFKDWKDV